MINKSYFNILKEIKEVFNKEGSVQLKDFLEEEYFKELQLKYKKAKFKEDYDVMKHKLQVADIKDEVLDEIIRYFLFLLTGRKLKLKESRLYCLKHKDYSIMRDDINEEKGITVVIELTEDWNREANGYNCYVKDNKEIGRIYPLRNNLSIIKTDNKMSSFIKYVNHLAGKNKRKFIKLEY